MSRLAFVFLPHKSLDRIQEEHGVKIPGKAFKVLGELLVKAMKYRKGPLFVYMGCRELGESLGLKEDKLHAFAEDLARTLVFYHDALKKVGELVKPSGARGRES